MPNASFITLDEVITDYINESEQSNHKFFKLWHIAFRGMDKMGLAFFYQVKSVPIPITSSKIAYLPPDYLKWSKVGIFNGSGELAPLAYNKNLSTYAALNPSRLTAIQATDILSNGSSSIFYNYLWGGAYRNIYGLPSGNNIGSFNIDETAGVIILNNCDTTSGSIVLEYVASPQEGETYYIPVQFREAMVAWLAWRDIQNLPPSPRRGYVTDKAAKRKEFFNEQRLAIAAYNPFRISEAYQVNLENQRMCIKS